MLGHRPLGSAPLGGKVGAVNGDSTTFGFLGANSNKGTGTILSVTIPVVPAPGNILLAFSAIDATTTARTWPEGFVEQAHITVALDGQSLNWAYKVADGTEGSTFGLGAATTANLTVAIECYGNSASTPIGASSSNADTTTSASPWSVVATGLASGAAGRILVYCGGVDNATTGTVTSAAPSASPAAWTERVDDSNGNFTNLGIYDVVDTAGTFTSDVTAVQTGSGNAQKLAFLIAIDPVVAAFKASWARNSNIMIQNGSE